jgi:hypothetical protein
MDSDVIVILLLKTVAARSCLIEDTKVFGNCLIHIKRFRENPITVDPVYRDSDQWLVARRARTEWRCPKT